MKVKRRMLGDAKRMLLRMILRTPWLGARYVSFSEWRASKRIISAWERDGRPVPPPPEVKHRTLIDYARKYGLSILVETGTLMGGTVAAVEHAFDRVYTIEIDDTLFKAASKRFEQARNIEVIHGDSGVVLGKLMAMIREPALFWLDGHYSGGITGRGAKDTPILEELTAIFNAPDLGHVIIIDDARDFGTGPDYPGLGELIEFIQSGGSGYDVVVRDDSIRATPRAPGG